MSFSIHLTEEALQEEIEAFLFYENEQPGLGERFLKEVEAALQKGSEHPDHYSFADETKTIRDISLIKFPFVIIFEIETDKTIIYHIHHTKKELK
jgi:plasmid stabilization system protein ParE